MHFAELTASGGIRTAAALAGVKGMAHDNAALIVNRSIQSEKSDGDLAV